MDQTPKLLNTSEKLAVSSDDINMIKNIFADPRQKTEGTRRNLEAAFEPGTKDVIEAMDEPNNSTCRAEISEVVAGPSFEGIGEVIHLKVTPESNQDSICEIKDPGNDTNNRNENIEVRNTREIMIEKCKNIFEQYVYRVGEIVNPYIASSNSVEIRKIMNQSNANMNENLLTSTVSTTEESNEIMNRTTEDIHITEKIEATPSTIGGIKESVDLEATFIPGAHFVDEMINKKADTINAVKKSETALEQNAELVYLQHVPITEKVTKIMDQATEDFNMSENLKATLGLSREDISQVPTSSETIPNITFKTLTFPMTIATVKVRESEKNDMIKSKILTTETKQAKSVLGRKRKRKVPPISEMVTHSIKSQKMNNGASFQEIKTFMEENYPVTVKALLKYHVDNYLEKWVDSGMLEKVDGIDAIRFKFKEMH